MKLKNKKIENNQKESVAKKITKSLNSVEKMVKKDVKWIHDIIKPISSLSSNVQNILGKFAKFKKVEKIQKLESAVGQITNKLKEWEDNLVTIEKKVDKNKEIIGKIEEPINEFTTSYEKIFNEFELQNFSETIKNYEESLTQTSKEIFEKAEKINDDIISTVDHKLKTFEDLVDKLNNRINATEVDKIHKAFNNFFDSIVNKKNKK